MTNQNQKTPFLQSAGFGLSIAAAAVVFISALAFGLYTMFSDVVKSQNTRTLHNQLDNFHDELRASLGGKQSCLNSLGSLELSSGNAAKISAIKNSSGVDTYVIGKTIGDITIESMAWGYIDTDKAGSGEASLSLSYSTKLKTLGPEISRPRTIVIRTRKNLSTNAMLECEAIGKMSDGVWHRNPAAMSQVFYLNGAVSIGTTDVRDGTSLAISGAQSEIFHDGGSVVQAASSFAKAPSQSAWFIARRGHGSHLSPLYPNEGDQLGGLSFQNMKSTSGAGLEAWASETHSEKKSGTDLRFMTVANGSPFANASPIASERARITNDGRIGIGTKSPHERLELSDGKFRFGTDAQAGGLLYAISEGSHGGKQAVLTIADGIGGASDEIYIGPNTFTAKGIIQLSAQTTSINGNMTIAGCLKDSNGRIIGGTCSSDERLKTDIHPTPLLADRLGKLVPKYYRWKSGPNSTEALGLIAQEVQKVFPELVTVDTDGFFQVRYSDLTFYLIEGFREHEASLMEIAKENTELKARVIYLEQELTVIKKHLGI
jgi:hypothetical protein